MESLTERIETAGFEYVNGLINERNFPLPEEDTDLNGFVLRPSEEAVDPAGVLSAIESEGLRPATVYELIAWWNEHSDEIEGELWVVAFKDVFRRSPGAPGRMPFASRDEYGILTLSMGFSESDLRGVNEYLLCFPA